MRGRRLITRQAAGRHEIIAVAVLILAIAFGCVVRLDRLTMPIVFSDEAFSWRVIGLSWYDMVASVEGNVHPPGYFALLKLWRIAWGDSPGALRWLSVVGGIAAIPLSFALFKQSSQLQIVSNTNQTSWSFGALLASGLVAIHPLQVDSSRVARMYSSGVFLTGITSCLLIAAMRSSKRWRWWWIGYGVAAAAFLYVHYFAIFTIIAQVTFVVTYCVFQFLNSQRCAATRSLVGVCIGMVLFVVLYVPWAPSFVQQVAQVREHYWIQPTTSREAQSLLVQWLFGIQNADGRIAIVAILVGQRHFSHWVRCGHVE